MAREHAANLFAASNDPGHVGGETRNDLPQTAASTLGAVDNRNDTDATFSLSRSETLGETGSEGWSSPSAVLRPRQQGKADGEGDEAAQRGETAAEPIEKGTPKTQPAHQHKGTTRPPPSGQVQPTGQVERPDNRPDRQKEGTADHPSTPATTTKPKAREQWAAKCPPPPGAGFCESPLVGTLGQLCYRMDCDRRTLRAGHQRGLYWIRMLHYRRYELYVQSPHELRIGFEDVAESETSATEPR
jgi:hypothetical protein